MTCAACAACATYEQSTQDALDDAGREHREALATIRDREAAGQPPVAPFPPWPDRNADAFVWTAPHPTRPDGRA